MPTTQLNRFESTLDPQGHPYLTGAWTPVHEEVDATDLEVIGTIPSDFSGVYLRNTENPVHQAIGTYHPFDGDGMLHAMHFDKGQARYSNRFIRTKGFIAEQEAGRSLWAGAAANPALSEREGWGARGGLKDASSTDVIVHAGEVLTTFWQCGEGYRLDPFNLKTLGTYDWVPAEGISAHPKVDPETGELLFFNYSKKAPYMHYGVVGADGRLKHITPIPLPGPRLPHDMAFTKNYTILNDLPLFWDEELLKAGVHHARFHPELPSRFAILPRYGSASEIRWFEADPCYVLHWVNAFELGDEIILDGYFEENPDPKPQAIHGADKRFAKLLANVDEHAFRSKLHRWRFNLKTGTTIEERLDDRILEFGTSNAALAGRPYRYAYSTTSEPGWFLFNGVVKHDLETGDSWSLDFGDQRFGSEAPFAPRLNPKSEDDGYLLSFITDMGENRSECLVVDALDVSAGPVCRIILPHRISSGTHATWASLEEIRAGSAARR